jgi:hypothetical protein
LKLVFKTNLLISFSKEVNNDLNLPEDKPN